MCSHFHVFASNVGMNLDALPVERILLGQRCLHGGLSASDQMGFSLVFPTVVFQESLHHKQQKLQLRDGESKIAFP